ncbi:MAG: Mrp/NBP35 family ATP-binding protein [Candidatus Aenigmarchaeota archaeon]|nr:Mrp/NBP35 family ATP-binding protein [Candidatus Aenigmarchaeota archaeon]
MPSVEEVIKAERDKRMLQQKERVAENLKGVKRRIAVMSGKGGVGKTTVAVNIAALLAEKHKVGLFDIDIDCPNVGKFLGITEKVSVDAGNRINPIEKHGMKVLSMAFLQGDEKQSVIWRGPIISNAILQFMEKTNWGDLDYLFCDMPPGTSDAALTMIQLVGIDAALIVSTPQTAAITDARKAIDMCRHMAVPVLGIVENMSGFFGSRIEQIAKEEGIHFLGSIELRKDIAELSDLGLLPVKESAEARRIFEEILNNFPDEYKVK